MIPLGITLKGLDPWFCSYKPCLPAPPPKTSLQNQVPADFTTSQLSTKWGGQPFFSNHKPSERAPSPPARYPKLLYEIRNLVGKQQGKIDELLSLSEERPFCRGSICWFLALLLRLAKMAQDPDFVVGFWFYSGVPDFVVKICDKKSMGLSMSNSLEKSWYILQNKSNKSKKNMNKIKQKKQIMKTWNSKTNAHKKKKTNLKFQNPKFPNSPIQKKTKFQNPNPKAFTKFHKSKHPKIPDSLTQKCVSTKCVWTLDPLQNQKTCPKISCLYKIATQT